MVLWDSICLYAISGFRREVDEVFVILGYKRASSGNSVTLLAAQ
jgi:hypothetical protein